MRTCIAAFLCLTLIAAASAAETARGVVYNDTNKNMTRDEGERGVPDVLVSNGIDVVKTGTDGSYQIEVGDDTVIFVCKPKGWQTVVDHDNVPRFYYIHNPKGSPKLKFGGIAPTGPLPASVDFPLYKHEEPSKFQVVFFGDTQVRNEKECDYLARDVVAELVGTDAAFGVVLGDIVFDDLSVFPALIQTMGRVGIPIHYVHGNHDMDYDTDGDEHADDTHTQQLGPANYAFQYGDVYFITLDNINWQGGHYTERFGEKELQFLRNYLANVPADARVVTMMHAPIMDRFENRRDFLEVLDSHPKAVSFAAHWHKNLHAFFGENDGWTNSEPHHHWVAATACGSWWSGVYDEEGIPHTTMYDGVPNGYTVATFDGGDYKLRFKAARRPAEHQMTIIMPGDPFLANVGNTDVIVNFFAGTERDTLQMRVDGGPWLSLIQYTGNPPWYEDTKLREEWLSDNYLEPLFGDEGEYHFNRVKGILDYFARQLPGINKTGHLWVGSLPDLAPGGHLLEVRARDMFGQEFSEYRPFRVKE